MIRRFEWIRDVGYFGDFSWPSDLPEFARINVVYGPTGSGKTSLSRVFDGLRPDRDGCRLVSAVVGDDGPPRTSDGGDDPIFGRVMVFSEAYVERSHRFGGAMPDMDAILTLGVRTVEDEEALQLLRAERDGRVAEQSTRTGEKQRLDEARRAAYERVSSAVVGDLASTGGRYASRGSYSRAMARRRMEELGGRLAALPPDELAACRRQVVGGNREPLPTGSLSLVVEPDLVERASRLLGTTPLTRVLDTLLEHPQASAWVQQGLPLHEQSESCAFCGAAFTADRRAQIEQHFSEEVGRLQGELAALGRRLEELSGQAASIVQGIPDRGLLFDDLREAYAGDAQGLRDQVAAFRAWCAELGERLALKRADVLAAVAHDVVPPPAIDGAPLSAVRDQHNRRVADHAALVAEAASAIERHHLHAEAAGVRVLTGQCEGVSKRARTYSPPIHALMDY